MQSFQIRLAELYTAVFDRAPDAAGLAYWSDELSSGKMNLETIAANWMTSQPEALERYPQSMSSDAFIQAIYANVLDRQPVTADYAYWGTQLDNGSVSRDAFIAAIINGAKANDSAQGQLDAALLANNAAAGIAFAEQGLNDQALAAAVVAVVDSSAQSTRAVGALIQITQDDFDDLPIALEALGHLLANSGDQGLQENAASYLEGIAANVYNADRDELFAIIRETLTNSLTQPAELADPQTRASESLALAGNDPMLPDSGAGVILTGTAGVTDTFSFAAGTHAGRIEQFEVGRDLLSLDAAAGVKVLYRGEGDSYAALATEEFDGTPGQAAMVRSAQELVIDVNGDNLITAADVVIGMPGVWQLEDYNFI
ncbi:DUF4214 domain-containing protein [Stutzerimonas kunmingensis]|uniref:DUF4214 domain-containing protein n=1 Tax=Stutzerimonas kunmingensis TaxID=1211807 RepID=UPI0028AFDA0F|nr:DUF4214 domain-containing protein [Stutzerimonas kunmingensis]